jgi:stress response protein SCP2|tara:strand:+ start:18376 stop:18624 length:249 start_codon:yes stop_codon:yes gene_type:complete
MSDKFGLIDALAATYQGEIKSAQANIKVYLDNPAGIGEHSDIVAAIDVEVQKLSDAIEKLETVRTALGNDSVDVSFLSENKC